MSSEPDVVRPASVDELAAALREATQQQAVVRVRGAGTKWTWGATGARPDVVVDTTAMDAVVEHSEGDLVLTVDAGARLDDVGARLAPARQWLALDPPEPGATVGGVVAAAASGPHRLRFGTPRDLLLGVTVVLADGTVAHSGGKVVKNVAGYDLGKLFAGSFGTLGVIAGCTFRLHPSPAARRVVTVATDDPAPVAKLLARSPVATTAVEWDGSHLHALVESSPAATDAQVRQLAGALDEATISERLPAGFGQRPWRAGDVAVKVTHRLSALADVIARLRAALPSARLSAHVGSGVVWAGWSAPPEEVAGAIDALRTAAPSYDGSVVVVDAPPDVKQALDVWGPVRGLDVMRRAKDQFDPDHRMSPGVFVGGI